MPSATEGRILLQAFFLFSAATITYIYCIQLSPFSTRQQIVLVFDVKRFNELCSLKAQQEESADFFPACEYHPLPSTSRHFAEYFFPSEACAMNYRPSSRKGDSVDLCNL
ncbi:hypothetical protein RvY_03510 [Ramazzottius varieornatus]|uniref:Uncharacterized protein n=1 Tax=Ramazzottius varieornatus TaxID=947166 RepID=A0A1D1UVD7_RAMVA|nr:hypothetical protein RvY_03510 [Ramazzottius varieornatus]